MIFPSPDNELLLPQTYRRLPKNRLFFPLDMLVPCKRCLCHYRWPRHLLFPTDISAWLWQIKKRKIENCLRTCANGRDLTLSSRICVNCARPLLCWSIPLTRRIPCSGTQHRHLPPAQCCRFAFSPVPPKSWYSAYSQFYSTRLLGRSFWSFRRDRAPRNGSTCSDLSIFCENHQMWDAANWDSYEWWCDCPLLGWAKLMISAPRNYRDTRNCLSVCRDRNNPRWQIGTVSFDWTNRWIHICCPIAVARCIRSKRCLHVANGHVLICFEYVRIRRDECMANLFVFNISKQWVPCIRILFGVGAQHVNDIQHTNSGAQNILVFGIDLHIGEEKIVGSFHAAVVAIPLALISDFSLFFFFSSLLFLAVGSFPVIKMITNVTAIYRLQANKHRIARTELTVKQILCLLCTYILHIFIFIFCFWILSTWLAHRDRDSRTHTHTHTQPHSSVHSSSAVYQHIVKFNRRVVCMYFHIVTCVA